MGIYTSRQKASFHHTPVAQALQSNIFLDRIAKRLHVRWHHIVGDCEQKQRQADEHPFSPPQTKPRHVDFTAG
jgi:hypothetical protein